MPQVMRRPVQILNNTTGAFYPMADLQTARKFLRFEHGGNAELNGCTLELLIDNILHSKGEPPVTGFNLFIEFSFMSYLCLFVWYFALLAITKEMPLTNWSVKCSFCFFFTTNLPIPLQWRSRVFCKLSKRSGWSYGFTKNNIMGKGTKKNYSNVEIGKPSISEMSKFTKMIIKSESLSCPFLQSSSLYYLLYFQIFWTK